jgi:transcriptional regulator with XRE-family HTH domain
MFSERVHLAILLSRMRGVPQYRLAIRTGFTPTLLSSLVHGAVKVSRDDVRIQRLAEELGVDVDEFFEGDESTG